MKIFPDSTRDADYLGKMLKKKMKGLYEIASTWIDLQKNL